MLKTAATAAILAAILVAGCTGGATTSTTAKSTASKGSVAATSTSPTSQATAPAPIVLQGTTDYVSDPITNTRGLVRLTMNHLGTGNFAITVKKESGEYEALWENDIGNVHENVWASMKVGSHYIEVNANGAWNLTIEQPSVTGVPVPKTLSGTGTTAATCVQLSKSLHKFTLHHDGERNFIVVLYDASGRAVSYMANEIGPYDGTVSYTPTTAGPFCPGVQADGNWSIAVT